MSSTQNDHGGGLDRRNLLRSSGMGALAFGALTGAGAMLSGARPVQAQVVNDSVILNFALNLEVPGSRVLSAGNHRRGAARVRHNRIDRTIWRRDGRHEGTVLDSRHSAIRQ